VITPDATPEEVAAIVAAITACTSGSAPDDMHPSDALDDWVRAARLAARRTGMARGAWRLSGRVERRTRPR
jgi:acyl-CoA carboxylase epsilon subunit-like protein